MSQPPDRRSDNRFQRRSGGRPEGGGRRFASSSSGPPPRWGAARRPEGSRDRPPFDRRASEGKPYEGKPYEGKSFEGKPYENKTYQGKSYEGKPYQGKFNQGRSFEGRRPGLDRSGPSRSGPERSGAERPNVDRPRGDRSWGERPGADRPRFNRPSSDRPGGDRAGADRFGADRPGGDRPGAERFSRFAGERRPGLRRSNIDRPEGRPGRDSRPFSRDGGEGPRDRPSFDRPRLAAGGSARFRDGDRRPRPGARAPFGAPPPARSLAPRGLAPMANEAADEQDSYSADAPSDLVWGRHSSLAVLESGRPVHRVWCTPEMRFSPRFLQLLRDAKASGVLVEEVTWARLGQISGGAVHQGIVLQPAAAETLDLTSLIEGCAALGEAPLLMAVDGLTDPHNLGAILRSAEALGAHGMVLPQRRNAGLTGSVAKVAAGALEHLPVARVVNLNRSLEALKQEGYRVIGLAEEGNVTLEEADLDGPLVVVTGSEGEGLSLLTRRNCDQLVRIPLRGATPSLNASVATALLLYEIARRGWMAGLQGHAPAPRLVRPAMASAPLQVTENAPSSEPQDDQASDLKISDPVPPPEVSNEAIEMATDPSVTTAPQRFATLPQTMGSVESAAEESAFSAPEPEAQDDGNPPPEPLGGAWHATIGHGEQVPPGDGDPNSPAVTTQASVEPTPSEPAPTRDQALEEGVADKQPWHALISPSSSPSSFDNDILL